MFSGYHWFVAWRYLMARPRKWSVPLAITAGTLITASVVILVVAFMLHGVGEVLTGVSAACALAGWLTVIMFFVRRYFTFFTTVSISGVMIGTMALVIVLSVMSGFETDLRQKILGFNAHLLVTKTQGEFSEYKKIGKLVDQDPDVVAETPYVTSEVVIAANNNYANVIIKGINPKTVSHVTDLAKNVRIRKVQNGIELTPKQIKQHQKRAMRSLWPMYDDAGVRDEPPPDGGVGAGPLEEPGYEDAGVGADATDPPPPDFDVGNMGGPIDLAGDKSGGDTGSDQADEPPDDMDVGDMRGPIDLSGGLSAEEVARQNAAEAAAEAGDDGVADDGVADANEDDDLLDFDRDGASDEGWDGDGGVPDLGVLGAKIDIDDELPPPRIPARVAILPGILVGQELVKQIHLYPGQEVRIVSPLGEMTPQGRTFYTRFYRVAGRFYTGMYEYDLKFVYVDMASLQAFLNLGDQAKGLEIRVRDPERAGEVRERLQKKLGDGYRVQDWQELNRSLFSALKLEKIAMFLVLGIIIVVASFSIIGTLIMVVIEKAREIALLKTLGSSDRGVMQVFVSQGFFIGMVGTLSGVALGLTSSLLLAGFGFPLDPDVYYMDRLPVRVEWGSVAMVAAAGILISAAATIYPALIAARLRPAEGMRYE